MTDNAPDTGTTRWQLMRNGVWEPATEDELKAFIERMGIFSDAKGICSAVMDQMMAEIGRLRAIVRVNGLRSGHSHAEIDALLSNHGS